MVQKFPEIPETVEFPKCEPFNRNSRNSGSKVEWKKTSGKTTTYAQIFGNFKFPKIWAYVVVNFLSHVIFVFGYGKCMLMKLKKKKDNNYLR